MRGLCKAIADPYKEISCSAMSQCIAMKYTLTFLVTIRVLCVSYVPEPNPKISFEVYSKPIRNQ